MKKILLILFGSLYLGNAQAQKTDKQVIYTILDQQIQAWNNGNIEAFMNGYWNNDSLMFIGKSGVTYGYQKTLDNYKKNYADEASMGKLHFTIIQEKPLDRQHYFIIGKWHLQRSIGNIEGHFTLLFKKIKKQWVIIADHSS
jgi:ketosteroid isomerase-like protein